MRNRVIVFGIICIIGLFLVFNTYGEPPKTPSSQPTKSATTSPSPSDNTPLTRGAFIQIAQRVTPAVVNVYVMGESGVFNTKRLMGNGTGFIIDAKKGILLTNEHVARNAGSKGVSLKIGLHDKRSFKAKVIGTDTVYDCAVIQIENPPADLKQVTLGNSDKVAPGEMVMAIGQPYGYDYTVTTGIVCALGRILENIGGHRRVTMEYLETYMQLDVLINPGNSGGPLFNLSGEVIGVNTAGGRGYGYAIPINAARAIKDKILKDGKIVRAYLGLTARDFTNDYLIDIYNTTIEELIKDLGLKEAKGVFIQGCADDSPAKTAGLVESDVITEFDGKKVNDMKEFRALMETKKPGDSVQLKLMRGRKEETVSITLSELGASQPETPNENENE